MATMEQYALRWNNYHTNLTSGFHDLLQAADMVDVTLAVDGQMFQAHKIVLSICSPYFKELFKANPCNHPIVIMKDVPYGIMKDILQFMYLGEVNVLTENLRLFLRTAELLQVKGLTADDSSETSSKRDERPESLSSGEEEQDLTSFNHMFDLEISTLQHYSTPITSRSSPPAHETAGQQQKRPTRAPPHHAISTKRSKTEQRVKSCPAPPPPPPPSDLDMGQEDEETDFIEGPPSLKLDDIEQEEQQPLPKQFLESNGNGTSVVEANTQDQDHLLYTVDTKGQVYCPYCCRKFVNRYNLKVHIRDKHDMSPINLNCRVCGKIMRNRSCLRVHMYHHRKQQLKIDESELQQQQQQQQ